MYTSHELACSDQILSYVTWKRYFTRHAQLTHKWVPKGCWKREESQTNSSIRSVKMLPLPYKILVNHYLVLHLQITINEVLSCPQNKTSQQKVLGNSRPGCRRSPATSTQLTAPCWSSQQTGRASFSDTIQPRCQLCSTASRTYLPPPSPQI